MVHIGAELREKLNAFNAELDALGGDTPLMRVCTDEQIVGEVISAWTRKHAKLVAMKLVGEAGIPAGAVLDTESGMP